MCTPQFAANKKAGGRISGTVLRHLRRLDQQLCNAELSPVRHWIEEVTLKRIGTGDDMASIVSFLVGDDAAYITGAVLHANGGLYLP